MVSSAYFMRRPKTATNALIVGWMFCCFGLLSHASASETPIIVGEATLVLGKSYLVKSTGDRVQLRRGDSISVGDRIETLSGGHAHVRFIDEALLSVRPNSSLEVEEYRYDSVNPGNSSIKFRLDDGVARTISGSGAKASRGSFRLNTPVAAIGVRGTDFAVSASPDSTRALVNEGAIVIAPFSDTCLVSATGPCSGNSLELSRSGFRIASLQADEAIPRALPSGSLQAPDLLQRQLQFVTADALSVGRPSSVTTSTAGSEKPDDSAQNFSNEVLLEVVTSPVVRTNAEVAAEKVSSTDFIPTDAISVSTDGKVEDFDYTPPSLMTAQSLSDRQLVWGRYGDGPMSSDRLAMSFKEASAGRRISVGNLEYGLFRRDANPRRVATGMGLVGFQLTSAQALYNSETGVAVLRVDSGTLNIDFQSNTFDTALNMDHASLGQIDFTAAGRIFDGGFLRAIEDTQRLAGAVSYDGLEAGYLFEKQMADGTLSGLTLWNSQ